MIVTKGFYITQYLGIYVMKEYFKAIENLLSVFTRKETKPHVAPFGADFIKMMDQLDYEHPARWESWDSDDSQQIQEYSPRYFTKFKPVTPKLSPQQSDKKVPYLDLNAKVYYPLVQDVTPIGKDNTITMDPNDIGWRTELHRR